MLIHTDMEKSEVHAEEIFNAISRKGRHDIYDDYVDELFHQQLKECERLEHNYFLEHDEYSILKQKFRNKEYYNTTFGVNICDQGEELKYLLEKYEELDKLVEKITAETGIKY